MINNKPVMSELGPRHPEDWAATQANFTQAMADYYRTLRFVLSIGVMHSQFNAVAVPIHTHETGNLRLICVRTFLRLPIGNELVKLPASVFGHPFTFRSCSRNKKIKNSNVLILVTGGTGAQGGATAKALLAAGFSVRILTRSPGSEAAQALLQSGVSIVAGDMDDPVSLAKALNGAYGVFSVQVPDSSGSDRERKQGFALVDAALSAGVKHFVHTSVCEAGKHASFPRWDSGYWWQKYWTDKWDIEERVRHAGFAIWTVLKPAFMMDNFTLPKAQYMFPHLIEDKIITALNPHTKMQLTTADDVGAFASSAFAKPEKFNGKSIDLANDALTMDEVATLLSRVLHRNVVSESVSPHTAVTAGLPYGWVRSQEWTNEVGYRADINALADYDVPLIALEQWVKNHAREFPI